METGGTHLARLVGDAPKYDGAVTVLCHVEGSPWARSRPCPFQPLPLHQAAPSSIAQQSPSYCCLPICEALMLPALSSVMQRYCWSLCAVFGYENSIISLQRMCTQAWGTIQQTGCGYLEGSQIQAPQVTENSLTLCPVLAHLHSDHWPMYMGCRIKRILSWKKLAITVTLHLELHLSFVMNRCKQVCVTVQQHETVCVYERRERGIDDL